MTTANLPVRRATVDDLPKLIPLWQAEGLGWEALEKRFKEFQVVEAPGGELVGALGLEVANNEGRLHSEVFAHPEQADALRDLLWERMQVLAKNHGLFRLWTQFTTPFWTRCDFQSAPTDALARLPAAFGGDLQPWRVLQLRDPSAQVRSIEKEFAAFKEMEKQRTARIQQHAKMLKLFAALLVMALFFLVVFWLFAWFRARSQLSR